MGVLVVNRNGSVKERATSDVLGAQFTVPVGGLSLRVLGLNPFRTSFCINMLTHASEMRRLQFHPEERAVAKRTAELTIQKWGNNLAVRIPAAVARSARLSVGQPVRVSAEERGVVVHLLGEPKLSLAQKLARFDPARHGGEAMPTGRVGVEVF